MPMGNAPTAANRISLWPFVNITMNARLQPPDLPQPWGINDFGWSVRASTTFSNKLFFTTFLRYNNQQKYKPEHPVSMAVPPGVDLFIVYAATIIHRM
jgi:hypothetical protein